MSESLFGASPQPSAAQVLGPYEIGIHFNASVGGNVTGLAFYKSAADNTLSRTLSLWAGSGALLASATTSSEPTGTDQWLAAALSPPYPVQASTDYVVSFGAPDVYMAIAGGATPVTSGHLTLTSCCYGNTVGNFPVLADNAELDLADLAFAAAGATRLSAPVAAIPVAVPGELTAAMNNIIAVLNQTCAANGLPPLNYFAHARIAELPSALNQIINGFNVMLDQLGWDASNHLPPADVTTYRQPTQLINVMVNRMNQFA